jgi:hypothetical protein
MDEIAPGLFDWTAFHDGIGAEVHSHYALGAATLIDPMVPPEGLGWFERRGAPPERIVLTNRHHYRQSDRFVERFGCEVLCHEAGLHEFAGSDADVRGFAFGDELAPGVVACEVGALTPEETALHVAADGGAALAFADGLVRGRHGELGFVGPGLMGDDPDAVRAGLRAALARLVAELEFDTLLFAHGEPVRAGARSALMVFLEAPTAGGPPG